jgi:hypothetical protein
VRYRSDPTLHQEPLETGSGMDLVSRPKTEIRSLEQQSRPIQLEKWQGLSQSFLDVRCIDGSLPFFLNGSSDCNHIVGSPFSHFRRFVSLIALMIQFISLLDGVLSPYAL